MALKKLSLVRRFRVELKTGSSSAYWRQQFCCSAFCTVGRSGLRRLHLAHPGSVPWTARRFLETGARGPGDLSLIPWQRGLYQGALSVPYKANHYEKAWGGNYVLFIHRGRGGADLRKSPQTTAVLCQCLLPPHFAESSVWLPSPCPVSHSDNKREKGGATRAG